MPHAPNVDVRVGQSLLSRVLPPRTWPLAVFTFVAPLCVGLVIHALIQLDRLMMAAAVGVGVLALAVGSLPATLTDAVRRERASDAAPEDAPAGVPASTGDGHYLWPGSAGDRRWFIAFLALGMVSVLVWPVLVIRLATGVPAVFVGGLYLVTLGAGTVGRASAGPRPSRLIPWCYVVGPASAVALAALAMRPTHLGPWRDVVYMTMGRGAAVAAILYWLLFERAIRQRYRGTGPAPDALLPSRVLAFLLAATGFLVPGGGTPYAISWAAAWLMVAYHERRLAMR